MQDEDFRFYLMEFAYGFCFVFHFFLSIRREMLLFGIWAGFWTEKNQKI